MVKKVLVTGGAGFIGSEVVRSFLRETDWKIINVDKLTYAASLDNLRGVEEGERYRFYKYDICEGGKMEEIFREGVDYVLHAAAETHVDNSIKEASPFIRTNVVGTQVLLDLARRYGVEKFLYVSTDEVYGDLPLGGGEKFGEDFPLKPSSPYAASKAAGDLLVQAYKRTYGLPVMISRCSNNYGKGQYPEKLVPFFVGRLKQGGKVPVYGDGKNVREWIAVEDHVRALRLMLEQGEIGEIYNVGSGVEKSNMEVVAEICRVLGKEVDEVVEFVPDREGHDRRYALDSSKIRREIGWESEKVFEKHFEEIIRWYFAKF